VTGFTPIGDGFFNEPGFSIMLRKELGLVLHQLGETGFQRLGDLRVQLLPGTPQQATVGRVLHQRVLEGVDRVGRCASLEDKLGSDKAIESCLQLLVGKARNCAQKPVRELASDCRADLGHPPYRRQAIKPRH
jgi:hypothetical protein